MSQPLLDQSFDSCRQGVLALERAALELRTAGGSLADLVAVFDPEDAHVELLTRDDFREMYTRSAERTLVDYVDPPDAIRVVMLDHKGSGRSLLLSDLKPVLAMLGWEALVHGR